MVDLLCGSSAADGTTPPPGLLGTATRSAHPLRRALPPVGLVLAGGQSTRMGRDKTALVARGATLVERAAKKLAATGLQVVIADRGHARLPGWITVSDGPGQGPGAAILGAALAYPERALLVLACDLPSVPQELLAALAWTRGWDWTVPRWERGLEPLCALYRPAALQALAEMAGERGGPAPMRLSEADGLRVGFLDPPWISRFGSPADVFLNLNTTDDLARWKKLEGEDEPATKRSNARAEAGIDAESNSAQVRGDRPVRPPHSGQGQSSRRKSKR